MSGPITRFVPQALPLDAPEPQALSASSASSLPTLPATSSSPAAPSQANTSTVAKRVLVRFPERLDLACNFSGRCAKALYGNQHIPMFLCRLPGGKVIPISQIVATQSVPSVKYGRYVVKKNYFEKQLAFLTTKEDLETQFRKVKTSSGKEPMSMENTRESPSPTKMNEAESGSSSDPTNTHKQEKRISPVTISLSKLEIETGEGVMSSTKEPMNTEEPSIPGSGELEPLSSSELINRNTETRISPIPLADLEVDFSNQPYLTEEVFRLWHDFHFGVEMRREVTREVIMGLFRFSDFLMEHEIARLACLLLLKFPERMENSERDFLLEHLLVSDFEEIGRVNDQQVFGKFLTDCFKQTQSYQIIEKYALNGNGKAAFLMRNACATQMYGPEITPHLVPWLRRAAEAGYPPAQIRLGMHYRTVDQDEGLAFKWFQQAAQSGVPNGIFKLSRCYLYGSGVAADRNKGYQLEMQAVKAGDPEAKFFYGRRLLNGIDVPQDRARGYAYIKEAADVGYTDAYYDVAMCLKEGNGVVIDPAGSQTYAWLIKSDKAGNIEAAFQLGALHKTGYFVSLFRNDGIDHDQKAFEWYTKAANAGHLNSQVCLAMSYFSGLGCDQNIDLARHWYQKAAARGDRVALNWLANRDPAVVGNAPEEDDDEEEEEEEVEIPQQ